MQAGVGRLCGAPARLLTAIGSLPAAFPRQAIYAQGEADAKAWLAERDQAGGST